MALPSRYYLRPSETFDLVIFSSYEVKERAPYLGKPRLTVGEPTWKLLDRRSVETLVGQEVQENHPAIGHCQAKGGRPEGKGTDPSRRTNLTRSPHKK